VPKIEPSPAQIYYHYRLLRTIEDGFRLGGYLGNANAVPHRQRLALIRQLTALSSHGLATEASHRSVSRITLTHVPAGPRPV